MNGADFKYEGPVKREKQDQPIISEARQDQVAQMAELMAKAREELKPSKVMTLEEVARAHEVYGPSSLPAVKGFDQALSEGVGGQIGAARHQPTRGEPGKMFSRDTILGVLRGYRATWILSDNTERTRAAEQVFDELTGIFERLE